MQCDYPIADGKRGWFPLDVEVWFGPGEVAVRLIGHNWRSIYYNKDDIYAQAKNSGLRGVKAIIRALLASGLNPDEQELNITCFVYEEDESEDLVRNYRVARYDRGLDGILWKRRNKVTKKAELPACHAGT